MCADMLFATLQPREFHVNRLLHRNQNRDKLCGAAPRPHRITEFPVAHDNSDSNIDAGSARDLGTTIKKKIYPPNVKGWALIVGISKYKHDAWNLEYAHRDAETVADLIGTATGGKFTNIRLLVNEQATSAALNRALKSFLKGPDQDDIVLLYFACHGTPDPDRPGNIYLLTHDTEPDDISGTGLPMREIDYAVKTTLRAERVVILADTCHSGGIGVAAGAKAETNPRSSTST